MKYVLVLQWPASTADDYNDLVSMEEVLESALDSELGSVDGHDFGSNQMNIYIHTDDPHGAFGGAAESLGGDHHWAEVRAAFRASDGDRYEVIWPASLSDFIVV